MTWNREEFSQLMMHGKKSIEYRGEIDKRYNVVIAESGKIDIIKKSNSMQP